MSHLLTIFFLSQLSTYPAYSGEPNCKGESQALYTVESRKNTPWPGKLNLSLFLDIENTTCFRITYDDLDKKFLIIQKKLNASNINNFFTSAVLLNSFAIENPNIAILLNVITRYSISSFNDVEINNMQNCSIAFFLANKGFKKISQIYFILFYINSKRIQNPINSLCKTRMAQNYAVLNLDERAYKLFQQSLNDSYASNSAKTIGFIHNNIGAYHHNRGDIIQAETHYKAAIKALSSNISALEKFKLTHNLGGICYSSGSLTCAEEQLNSAILLAVSEEVPSRLKANSINKLAQLYADTGRFKLATEFYQKSLRILGDALTSDPHAAEYLGDAWRGLSSTHSALGEVEDAIEMGITSIEYFKSVNQKSELVKSYLNLAKIKILANDNEPAIEILLEAIKLENDEKSKIKAEIYLALSESYIELDTNKATKYFQESAILLEQNSKAAIKWWLVKATLHSVKREYLESLYAASKAWELAERTSQHVLELDSIIFSIDLLLKMNRTHTAKTYLLTASRLHEIILKQSIGVDTERAWNERRHKLNEINLRISIDQHGISALENLETLAMLDSLQTSRLRNTHIKASPKLTEIKRKLRLLYKIAASQRSMQASVAKQILKLELELETAYTNANKHPPMDTKSRRFTLKDIPDDTVILRYFLGNESSFLWIIDNTNINAYPLPSSHDLKAIVKRVNDTVSNNKTNLAFLIQHLNSLTPDIIPDDITNYDRAIIIPDGVFWVLPFSALRINNNYLIENLTIEYAPNLSLLDLDLNSYIWPEANIDIFANPRLDNKKPTDVVSDAIRGDSPYSHLPFAIRESSIIEKKFSTNVRVMLNHNASISNFLSSIEYSTDIIHFAGHGYFSLNYPNLNGLKLSEYDAMNNEIEGFFHSRELLGISSNTKLVVLNGCGTGSLQDISSEGGIGFAYYFHITGIPNVISTHWSVVDSVSAEFADFFYQTLLSNNSVATSLKLTQQHFINQRKIRHPYYWSTYRLDRQN